MIVRAANKRLIVGLAKRGLTGGAFLMHMPPDDSVFTVLTSYELAYVGGAGANGYDFFLTPELEQEYRKLAAEGY